ncbi:MerR family transcriptional regulator [Paenibacillus antri]|uniref:MerR family transcriptional regulator n=1 Tax=Paenibacillus antri TaxID=2582848 RepID=A0A5R9GKS7_9BACL|nr:MULTISPECIES: MerR family transcriptional regulator [Paenibacillus]TLS54244.1 MerR family transcriptional regulator [Paenibacillus antri]
MRGDAGGDKKLFKIGELAALCEVSPRTIDYYTKIGLIEPTERSTTNYRLYGNETLQQLKRIEWLKQQKLSLEEIKDLLLKNGKVSSEEAVTDRLTALQLHMMQLEREAKAIAPILEQLKPKQARNLLKSLSPQTAACIEALLLLIGKGPLM